MPYQYTQSREELTTEAPAKRSDYDPFASQDDGWAPLEYGDPRLELNSIGLANRPQTPQLKFKLVCGAILPARRHPLDAGLDIYSNEHTVIGPRSQLVIHTGVWLMDAPENIVIQIWSKSGLDAGSCIHVGAGIVDSGYRGEILVLLKNMGDLSVHIAKGVAIAQLVIVPVIRPEIVLVEDATESERGDSGGINRVLTMYDVRIRRD